MIDAATSVSSSPPARAPARALRDAANDFRTTLDTVAEKRDVARRLTERAKQHDGSSTPEPNTADTDIADPRTCGTPGRGKGQGIAGAGKTLPGKVADDEEAKDPIWLPIGVITPPTNSATCPLALPRLGGGVTPVAAESTLTSPGAPPAVAGPQLNGVIAGATTSPDWAPAFAGEASLADPGEGLASPLADPISKGGIVLPAELALVKAGLPVRIDAPMPAAPWAAQHPATQPAGQAFAAAIAAAVHAQPRGDEREPTDAPAQLTVASVALHAPAIAATGEAKQSALDLNQDSGLQGMIDHIEVLRDDADARDTRIRLVPDALGAVEVSVRKEGDRVHVHFTAEHAASARLLSEAQPRLADLADARGVKLGQTSVDSGAGNARQQPSSTIHDVAPIAASVEPTAIITDTRIA
ncbi:flagellar hook-length control protein FliK [Sphingomonas sp. PB4P5]|uniref:flagellar hook-length control protein FliK n=1 Tax=Parasphingomonas puruogangriensis TaxID=3096155 RepID=UPI002FC6549B